MSARNKCGYFSVNHEPTKYDTYLVKTNKGTYEFAHFYQNGWKIQGDNSVQTNIIIAWTEIPQTDLT